MVSQGFGANPAFYSSPIYGGIKGHNGLDLFAGHGNPVYATHDGFATFEIDTSGGHGVVVTTNQTFDYKNTQAYFKTIYWHLCDGVKEPKLKSPLEGTKGYAVKKGDLVGYADNTGASTGDHLHFGMKPMYKGGDGNLYNFEQNNGYLGAIDPTPYFEEDPKATEIKAEIEKDQFTLVGILIQLKDLLIAKIKAKVGKT